MPVVVIFYGKVMVFHNGEIFDVGIHLGRKSFDKFSPLGLSVGNFGFIADEMLAFVSRKVGSGRRLALF